MWFSGRTLTQLYKSASICSTSKENSRQYNISFMLLRYLPCPSCVPSCLCRMIWTDCFTWYPCSPISSLILSLWRHSEDIGWKRGFGGVPRSHRTRSLLFVWSYKVTFLPCLAAFFSLLHLSPGDKKIPCCLVYSLNFVSNIESGSFFKISSFERSVLFCFLSGND